MKVKDFNNKEYNFPPRGYERPLNDSRAVSDPHLRARNLLRQLYPLQSILEEVPLCGTNLRADFYLPFNKLIIEVHGQQHYKDTRYFFATKLDFIHAQHNDQIK